MKNPPHPGRIVRQECIEPLGLTVTESRIKGGSLYDGKAVHMAEAVSHAAWCSHSQPFDTALRAYSGQAVDLQEATSEPACAYPHADRPGIRIAEYCLVIT
jgi:hypothetical protein